MNKQELCGKILDSSYLIVMLLDKEIISMGTGICYHPDGKLLTAWHVIDPKMKANDTTFLKDPNLKILCRLAKGGGRVWEYNVSFIGFEIQPPKGTKKPFQIDLALLRPLNARHDTDYLPLSTTLARIGTDVLMCGFPDEMEIPFNSREIVDFEEQDQTPEFRLFWQLHLTLPLIKSGMIGNVWNVAVQNTNISQNIAGAVYWIDNASHYGSSGGPIVDLDGNLLGIIIQRTETEVGTEFVPNLRVPSGTTIALSHQLLPWAQIL